MFCGLHGGGCSECSGHAAGDRCSSYCTGESEEEEPLEIHTNSAGDAWMERLEEIKNCIAMLNATHNTIVSKPASLEKVVIDVQEDVTWMRGDVRVVHEVVEKISRGCKHVTQHRGRCGGSVHI